MSDDALLDPPPARPLWLWTLADLALLLVGFFVLVQATDRQALAKGLREGFGGAVVDSVKPDPIPLAAAAGRVRARLGGAASARHRWSISPPPICATRARACA